MGFGVNPELLSKVLATDDGTLAGLKAKEYQCLTL